MGLSGYETDRNRCLGRNGMSWANYFIGQIVRWPDGKARRWLLCRFVVLPDGVKALSFSDLLSSFRTIFLVESDDFTVALAAFADSGGFRKLSLSEVESVEGEPMPTI